MLKKYYSDKYEDPLVSKLKRISTKDKPLNVPIGYFPRGGELLLPGLKEFLVLIKDKQLGRLVIYLLKITKKMPELKKVKTILIFLNILLFKKLRIDFAAARSDNSYSHYITYNHLLLGLY